MSWLGDLFSAGGSKTTATRNDTMTKEQNAALKGLLSTYGTQIGKAAPSYPGQSYVGIRPEEQSYIDYASGKIQTPATQALLNVLQGQPAFQVNPETTQQFYEQSIRDPAVKEFKETIMPGLNESFSGPGFWSSGRAKATEDAYSDLSSNLASQRANLYYQDELSRRQSLTDASNRLANVAPGAVQMEATMKGSAGEYARMVESERLASDMARWLSGEAVNGKANTLYNPANQLILSLLGVQPFTYGSNTVSQGAGAGSSLLSALGKGLGAYGSDALQRYLNTSSTPTSGGYSGGSGWSFGGDWGIPAGGYSW